MLLDIHLVDEASVVELRGVHGCIVGRDALHVDGDLAVFVVGRALRVPRHEYHGGYHVELWHALAQALYVLLVHRPPAALAESLIGFCRLLCPYEGGVGGEAGEVLVELLLQAVAASDESHQHEHAPEHAEARQETPALVPRQRVENLSVTVYIYSHNANLLLMPRWA